ncbi:MAG: hypothetical protein QUS14_06610 [Pyrinomonadaceae bacterium]|nr:hypothetical protein [Pyrinomonadaceae bacterium]
MKNNLLLPLFILLVFAIGCSSLRDMAGGNSAAPGNSAANTGTATAPADTASSSFAPSSDPRADIEKLGERFLAAKSFRAKMQSTGGGPMNAEVDFIAPDRFRITTNTPQGEAVNMIIVGEATYMNAGGSWQKMPVDVGSMIPDFRDTFNREGMKGIKEVTFEGEDTAEGKPAYRYSYSGQAPEGGIQFTAKLWISKDSGYPLKINADYSSGAMKSMSVVYDYETPISIEVPPGVGSK